VERRVAGRSALARLIDTVFNGSPELLLTQLVSDRDLTDDQIKKLRRLMDARLRGDKR
jgi:predicted transcriptional regulator